MTSTRIRTSTPRFTFQSIPCSHSLLAENLPGFEGEEEKRRIVGDWEHVVGITLREPVRIIARDQIGKRILGRAAKAGRAD